MAFPNKISETLSSEEASFNLAAPYLFIVARYIEKISETSVYAMAGDEYLAYAKNWKNLLDVLYTLVSCNLREVDKKPELIDALDLKFVEYDKLGKYADNKVLIKTRYNELIKLLNLATRDLFQRMQWKKLIMPAEKITGKALAQMKWIDREAKF